MENNFYSDSTNIVNLYNATEEDRQMWEQLSGYYKKLAEKNKDNYMLYSEYQMKARSCDTMMRMGFEFNSSLQPGLIPKDWNKSIDNNGYNGNNMTQTNQPKINNNPYNFDFDATTEEKKLEQYIDADLPVFMHGKSGCGKSARVKELDPDCEIIYLSSARPETLIGKSIVIDGKLVDVPPTWYTRLCEKCEKEPNKKHIVFFDECTNALPSIQAYAFNIILDKEIDGKWKLPQNARIVAAGNEVSESLSANKMSEPLFRRFNHLYIETKLNDWLLWASKHDIHPAVYAFVASRGDKENQVLRTDCDGVNPCVDPRKWEMASKLLKTSGKANMLSGIIGPNLTRDFIEFCKKSIVTLDDVLNDNYDINMPRMKADDALATLIGLAAVNDQNVKKVRDFVKKYMIPEQYQNFVRMWSRGNQERLDTLREFDMLEPDEKVDDQEVGITFKGRKGA